MKKLPHPLILILGIGILLYWRSFSFDYTNFDDNSLIKDNQSYISNISNVYDAFRKTVFITGADVFYRPMETVWFILNAQVAGSDWKELPSVFHVSSLLLHVIAVYLIYLLLLRFNNSKETSLFLSLFFLVHPVLTQSVAWVPGVVDILVTVFALSSFLFFLDFVKSKHRKHYVLHILFFILAMYTKEIAVGIVPVCLLYLHFIEKEKLISYNNKVLLIGWLVVSALWFMMRDYALQNQSHKEFGVMVSSIVSNLPAFIQYIGKILFPFNLSVMPVMKDTTFLFGIVSLVVFSVVLFLSKEKRKNRIFFGASWFVIFLLPTFITTSTFRIHQFYEHRMYLPMAGVLFLLAETDWLKKFSLNKPIKHIAALLLIIFLFTVTWLHETTFSNTITFLENAVRTSPGSPLAHRNLGIYYQDQNMLREAAEEYKKSLAINPNEKELHNNLGVIYDTWNKKELAEKEYQAETKLNPSNSQPFHNLGVLYSEKNENNKAETYFKKAIEIRPAVSTYQQLALLYKKTGRQQDFEKIAKMLGTSYVQDANGLEKNSIAQNSTPSSDAVSLGRQLMQTGKLQEAEAVFKKILTGDSLNTQALFSIGLIYYSEKKMSEAEAAWRKCVGIDSTYTDAFNNLAICLAQQGKNSEAEAVLKKLVSSNPNYIDGYFNIANFYARNGKEDNALFYVNELKKRGATKAQFQQRGIKLSAELEKIFDK